MFIDKRISCDLLILTIAAGEKLRLCTECNNITSTAAAEMSNQTVGLRITAAGVVLLLSYL